MIHLLLNIQAKVIKIDDMIREGKIEIKGKEDRETLERYLTRIRNMSSRETIVGELCEIRCDKPGLSGGIEVMSCVDGLSIALRDKDKLAKEDK